MPEKVVMLDDGPWCVVDMVALLNKNDAWWTAQGDFAKLPLDRFKRTGLLQRKYYSLYSIDRFIFLL